MHVSPRAHEHRDAQLVRRLGIWSATGLVVGITIGAGIFRTPSAVATRERCGLTTSG